MWGRAGVGMSVKLGVQCASETSAVGAGQARYLAPPRRICLCMFSRTKKTATAAATQDRRHRPTVTLLH